MTKPETFTHTRNQAVEAMIARAADGIAADIAAAPDIADGVHAVVLGGGYGRGEGGATPEGKPYNDLDFFVIGKPPGTEEFFAGLSRKWKDILGIDVDFHPVSALEELYANAGTLMMQELFAGHRVIYGDREIFTDAPVMPFEQLPWREGARLLLNRGTGLLLARRRMESGPDVEFVRRNLHKAALGCGDALLIAAHSYRRHGTERLEEILRRYPGTPLAAVYGEALRYKYTPEPDVDETAEELSGRWAEMRSVYFESLMLFAETVCGRRFPTPFEAARGFACAGTGPPGNTAKNILLSLCRLSRTPSILTPLREHPRVKLPAMLVNCLDGKTASHTEAVFLKLWERFN